MPECLENLLAIPKIVLFCKYNFHHSIADPIYKELLKFIDKDLILLTGKRHIVYDMFEQTKEKFPIFVLFDEWGSLFRDCSEILITTGHSPANKNTTLSNRNSDMDYIFCPSQYYKTELLKRGAVPKKEIIVTGYPAASRIFRKEINQTSIFRYKSKDEKDRIKVLFAPTYNKDLNIIDALIEAEQKYDLFDKMKEYSITFKLHPVLYKKYPEQAKFVMDLSLKYSNIYYHEDSHDDITDAILWSDIVVGDCSGALLLAACNSPVIAYDNPNRYKSEYFDETGPEWEFRDEYAYRIDDVIIHELPYLIREFIHPAVDYKKEKRESIINLLFENQTTAEKVIAKQVRNLL